ncbi:hypothetical protein [Leptospira alstonii]|uniref:Uncharacterized protein n=1 Tax=Leptospira alstonii serovar Sichuan str. 79601 TaxID=1218565 RepID=M6DAD4_9LEPT|nr:hypothetical protein [Leptospira alstonii]AGS80526.1 hypothetical protein LEP1GSC193_0752 [Leptospira phage vB_LalZ_80412-LE1]EMJ95465.1 hypothetical protein LEP1GSC194_3552 [Leptospira alstonii serovar Sichuan str. 79601]
MNGVFHFLLKGIATQVSFGKKGPSLKATPSGFEVRLPDDSGLTHLKVASPLQGDDAVNLDWVRNEVLANWNTPVQNLEELRRIPVQERRDKQIREVEDELTLYQFDSESFANVPDPVDPLRTILPNDLNVQSPGRWLKTTARNSLHSQLIGLSANDHPQYELRSEKNLPGGYPGLSTDSNNPGIEILSEETVSVLKSDASQSREYLLPDISGTLALDNVFLGATELSNGNKGLVPAPQVLDREKFLSGDGSWRTNFGSLKNSSVKSSPYTATKYERVLCDVTSGGFPVFLPQNPNDNIVVAILDVSNLAGTNPITLLRNGEKIENLEEDWQLDLDGGSFELIYSLERRSWYFLGTPATSNLATTNGFLTNTPTFEEVSIAPSARSVKEYIEAQNIAIFQLISQIGVFLFGGNFAPQGTMKKNAFFEGTTNGSGQCIINTGLSNSILAVFACVSDNAGKWYFLPPSGTTAAGYFDNQGYVTIQFTGSSTFYNRNVRIVVEYK